MKNRFEAIERSSTEPALTSENIVKGEKSLK